ncbi:WecB/TagA/CpsF family glycosyltransferase [Paenibacillus popilliae]|uniref:N-acetylglucosaminyldiphosphoundecaprenol N-acetyl-beta-D-mannosaminyltransferase n=1 Tax=Paenibacillus popilliae ATCC 14706 TaxID=1212764 RepID=M9LLJ9_PAEPP|nr:WecB/TagA/CpsF family glycosyltransferase [Paenibacillus popilliae]GAC40991.1 teichoic acid biosynthesis protein [Paenibacillus popilliae ATCC 14706]
MGHIDSLAEIPAVSIYGIRFSKLNMKDTVACLENAIISGHSIQLITANPIMVMTALENDKFMNVMQQADLIIPDGTGIVWAANYAGDPVAERVTGFDLLHELMRAGEVRRWKVFLLGAAPDVVQAAAERLRQQYPLVQIVGVRDGFFSEAEDEAVVQTIREAAPDILFVARGLDTQEPWIAKHRHRLQVPLMMGVGGSFDVISGSSKRAPLWVQRLRLEWLYRLLREPKRFGRMMALPKFAWKVMRDKDKVTKVH